MATIRIFNDIFDDKSKEFIYDTSKPLLEQIEEHLDEDYYKSTMVECYDPDTKKTFYAPMEDEDEKEGIILYANGESVTEAYRPSENDVINVIFVPLSRMSNAGWGALIGLGAGIALGLMTGGAGFTALFPALTWTAGNVAFATIAGGALGALIGWSIGDKFDQMAKAGGPINGKKEGQQLPDVRGCSNQSLLGNNFPFVIGKHLVTPFIIGDPYTEYEGERGENAYIRELLCVGYGPLKLTDFKLGDFMLAYNQSHGSITKNTMIAGLLKGYSQTGHAADSGDIVDYWSKNDIEVEIIQQPDNAEIKFIDPYFQDRTKIDLSQRPLVSSETMNAAGWNVPSGEISTVYSSSYSNQDNSVTVLMTPINPDGTVLTPSELESFAEDCLASGTSINTARIAYNTSSNPEPYKDPYVINSLSLTLTQGIENIVELQAQFNGNWMTVLTLPAGGVSVSLSGTPRWPGTTCRLKIDEWTSAHFDINGSGSKNIELQDEVAVEAHPYNLLATFTGSDSVQQAETYAQALHNDQEEYYFNRDSIGYGSIYTEVTKESVSDANIFFLSDINLDEQAQVVYKGNSFPNQFRTNTVILSEACPRQFTINLDFPSGLYATYTQTSDDSTETKYAKIPLWMCIQWRIYDNTKKSSDPKGSDYDDWNIIDFGPNVNKIFGLSEQEEDKARHRGNNFSHLSLDDLYQGFRGKELQNFQYYAGNDGVSEFRVSATVTLTKEQCQQVLADTNPARIIEIRVLRVSPNYLNQTASNSSSNIGPYSYSDHVKVLTTVVKTFDMEALRNDDELKPVRVLSEKDLRKLCLVAIKAKADQSGYLQNNMESITCTAESFSPIWDSESKKILPEGITKVRKYYGYFEGNTDIRTNRTNTAYERELTGPDARQQYEDARHDGFNWYMEKAGSNFPALIKNEVYDDPVLHNDTLCWYLPDRAKKFNNNSASSGALLALFGEQSGPEAIGLEDLNIVAFSDWAEKSAAVEDGTKAPVAMDYNGHHYNEGDLIPVRYEANAYIYQGIKIEDLLQKLAFCGRAAWVIDEAGQVKFIMDAPVDYTKGAINAQNCISSSNSFNYEEPPAGLFITFHDENDGFENNSFYVWTDGNSAKRYHGSVEQLSMDYVTNNVQVTSLARYTLASRVQNKEILTRKIGPNGIIYSLGDVVLVQSDELLIGDVSGRIQEVIENNGTIYGFVMDSDYEYTAELDSNNVNSNQGVTIIQPSYMGKSNAVTLPLSSPRTQSVPLDYEQVYPVGTENPQAEGWYVKNGEQYVLTTDTTVVSGHVYYKAIMANYTLQKGLTNIVLFGKVIGDQYGIPRDTSEDYSAKTDVKYNFKTGDIAMMGLIEKISAPYRISKIKPEAGGKFTETLIPYDESFYNYGKALPTFQSYITPPQVMAQPVPLSEVPTTLKEQNDTLLPIYKTIGNLSLISYSCLLTMSAIGSAVTGTIYKDGVASTDNFYYVDYYGTQGTQPTTQGAEGVVTSGSFTIAAVTNADKHKVMIYSDNTKAQLICTAFVSYADGSDSSSYWLIEDVASIKKDKNGTFTPQSLNLTAKYQTGTSAPSAYSGRFKIEYATVQNPTSSQWTAIYTSSSDEASKQLDISSYTTAKLFRCSLYIAGDITNLLDQDIVSVVEDGQDGANAIAMTSATTPSGTYEGQVGIWQGQIYLWTNNAWVCQETNIPTDAVLHYSFDEIPDYPDGTADIRREYGDTYRNSTEYCNGNVIQTVSNVNGNLHCISTVRHGGIYLRNNVASSKIAIVRVKVIKGTVLIGLFSNIKGVGTWVVSQYVTSSFIIASTTDEETEWELEYVYIGDGSYSTPVIDNANGQNNATNNGGIAVQGVSGKGVRLLGNGYIDGNLPWTPWDKQIFSVSCWIRNWDRSTGLYLINNWITFSISTLYITFNPSSKNKIIIDVRIGSDLYRFNNTTFDFTQLEGNIFVACILNGTSTKLCVNGVSIPLLNYKIDVWAENTKNRQNFQIGRRRDSEGGYAYSKADFDDFQLFDRALSDTEVQALYLNKANTPKYYTLTDYQVDGIDDDGVITPTEKEMLYQKWIDIYKVLNETAITKNSTGQSGEYQKMLLRATTAGVSLDVAQGKDYVDATESLRAGLWTTANLANMSVQTKISAGAIDNLFNAYRTAYEALSTAIDVQNKATASALSISQSNSYHQIPTDAGGSALSYVGTDDIIYLLEGESKLTCVSTGTTLTAGKWKITAITMTNCTSATTKDNYTISDKGASIGVLTGISADSAKRTFTIQFIGNNASTAETIQIVQSFAKSKAGADGSSYRLIAEAYCVKTSTTVKFDAQKITGESVAQWIDGYLFYSTESSWTSLGQFKNGTAYKQLSLNVTADTSFRLCKSNSSSDYVDEASVKIFRDGAVGERGTGMYKITTAPTAYTTTVESFTPSYRIALSTVLSESGADKILVGDVLEYSYYHYPVGYNDGTYVYTGARTSIRGAQGTQGVSSKGYKLHYEGGYTYCRGLASDNTYSNTAQPYIQYNGATLTPSRDSSNYVRTWDNSTPASGKRVNCYVAYMDTTPTSWSSGKSYIAGSLVAYNNSRYICHVAHTSSNSILPTNTSYWASADIVNVYYNFADNKWLSVLTNTPLYVGATTTGYDLYKHILIGKIRSTGTVDKQIEEIDPVNGNYEAGQLLNSITYLGIVGTTQNNYYTSRYYVLNNNTTFTRESSSSTTAETGTLVLKRGHSGTTGTGASDSNQCLQICNGYSWETVGYTGSAGTTNSLPMLLQKCQNMAMMGLVAMAKVYSANNVTLPKCCGQVFDLLIANTAFIEALFSKFLTMQEGGLFKSENWNGSFNQTTGAITQNGTTGWALDSFGKSDFVDIHAQGGTFSQGTFNDITVNSGDFKGSIKNGTFSVERLAQATISLFRKEKTDMKCGEMPYILNAMFNLGFNSYSGSANLTLTDKTLYVYRAGIISNDCDQIDIAFQGKVPYRSAEQPNRYCRFRVHTTNGYWVSIINYGSTEQDYDWQNVTLSGLIMLDLFSIVSDVAKIKYGVLPNENPMEEGQVYNDNGLLKISGQSQPWKYFEFPNYTDTRYVYDTIKPWLSTPYSVACIGYYGSSSSSSNNCITSISAVDDYLYFRNHNDTTKLSIPPSRVYGDVFLSGKLAVMFLSP